MPQFAGRKSWYSEPTMMTKRSNHMPMLMSTPMMKTTFRFRRTFLNQSNCVSADIDHEHDPAAIPVGVAEEPVAEHPAFIRIAAIPGDEIFHQVDVGDDQAAHQRQLADACPCAACVMMSSRWHHLRSGISSTSTMPKPQIHRADDEVERENRRVPARELRRAEVQADDGTHREHQQRAQAAQDDVGLFVIVPLPRRTGPAHRQEAVNEFPHPRRRAVAQHGEVGNHPMYQNSVETIR